MDKIEKIKIPKYWKYTESWCQRVLGAPDTCFDEDSKYFLDKICKAREASFNITYALYERGSGIFQNIKNLNLIIEELDDYLEEEDPDYDNLLFEAAGDADGGTGFDTRVDKEMERIYKKNNVELAPDFIDSAFKEMIEMAKNGVETYKNLKTYINKIEHQRQAKFLEDQEEKYSSSYSKVDQIELKHAKVESGFVYILSNELMPNIYKVGFTARNPDERAVEITSKSGLPKPFKVEKYWRSDDPYIVEQRIHGALSEFAEGREYFKGDLNEICEFIDYQVQHNNQI